MKSRRRAAVLAIATGFDLTLGEPPSRLHPVVWLGRLIDLLERRAPAEGRTEQLAWGAAVAAGVPAVAALAGFAVERLGERVGPGTILLEAAALKWAFACRALLGAGEGVRHALEAGDETAARASLRALVSRDTAELTSSLMAAAAIESLAENATDSFIAPWLAYAAGGLPGAYAYRAINTLDSMIGYRGRYEYLGKAPARLDDLTNLFPARLAAVLLVACARVGSGSAHDAWRMARRHHRRTASPNAGWTMAAMAGALGVRLEKVGHYALGDGRAPGATDVRRAQRIVAAMGAASLALIVGSLWSYPKRRSHA